MMGSRQPPAKPPERKLSSAERQQRQEAPLKSSLYVKSPNGLRLRYRLVRRLVRKMKKVMPWLDAADDPACRAWAELEILGSYAFADLMDRGLTNRKGDPRRLLSDYRQLRQAQLGYGRELGLTPLARASLGLSVARMQDLASAMAEGARDGG